MTPSRSPFEYAVIRIVPDIEREEFLNVGLIMFSRELRYLLARASLDEPALESLRPGCDVDAIREQLRFVEEIATGEVTTAPFNSMSQSERFHWLTTPRSTLVQTGPLHAGTTEEPGQTFEHLYRVMVDR